MNPCHRRFRLSLAACALLIGVAGAAQAQYAFDDTIMPPRAVAWRLSERGFTGIARPRFDGRAYVVEAFDPGGARVRLFVDAQDGAILGRRRMDDGPVAIARPAPGYGWTEEETMPRRPMRQAERLLPPGDIPMPESRGVPLRRPWPDADFVRREGAPDANGRRLADPNPNGINPDRRGPTESPRRLARTGNPARVPDAKVLDGKGSDGKAQARTVPDGPKLRPLEAAKPDPTPATPVATMEQPKAAAPTITTTPAAVQPPADGTVAKPLEIRTPDTKAAEGQAPDAKSPKQAWQNPPETKRNVRVIGGATLVPGGPDKDAPTP